jgi:hypothetical protein
MDNAWPLWALPFWTMGVPLLWAVVERSRSSKSASTTTHFGVRPLATGLAGSPIA